MGVAHNLMEKEKAIMITKRNETFIEPSYHKPAYYDSPVFPNFPQHTQTFNPKYTFLDKNSNAKKYNKPNKKEEKQDENLNNKISLSNHKLTSNEEKLSYSPIVANHMISKVEVTNLPDLTQYGQHKY